MDEDLIGLPDIARLCGVPAGTARKWHERHVLPVPAVRRGGRAYWHRADIDRWRAIDRPAGWKLGRSRKTYRKTST